MIFKKCSFIGLILIISNFLLLSLSVTADMTPIVSVSGCKAYQYRCSNGQCIDLFLLCDGERDCKDGSDEAKCGSRMTNVWPMRYACQSKDQSIPAYCRCDGKNNCDDSSDEKNCTGRLCTVQQFRCNDGTCIKGENVCNRFVSCKDQSDETFCTQLNTAGLCSAWQFRCNNGRCVQGSWRCDGVDQCGDNSDEIGCKNKDKSLCNWNQFACKTGAKCIPLYWRCDGHNDCSDKSDEINCNKQRDRCPPYEFQCDNGMCLERFAKCDGYNDCGDASDELDCPKPAGGCDECEFLCENSAQCIPVSYRCDGLLHCADASDEWECTNFVIPTNCSSMLSSSSTTEIQVTSSTLKMTTSIALTYSTDLPMRETEFQSEQASTAVSTTSKMIDRTVFQNGSVETSSEDNSPRYIVLAASILTVILLVGCIVISRKCFDCKCPTQQYEIDESMEIGEFDKENKTDDEAIYEEIVEDPERHYDHLHYDSCDEADKKNLQSIGRNKPVSVNNYEDLVRLNQDYKNPP